MFKRIVAVWVLMATLMSINGLVREFGFARVMDAELAELMSVATGIVIVFSVAYLFVKWESLVPGRHLWAASGVWTVLTVLFELALGYTNGVRGSALFSAYDVAAGEAWLVVLMSVACAPVFWAYHQRALEQRRSTRVHFPLIRL